MSALLRIYDNVTSNKYASLGITVASTAYSLWWTSGSLAYIQPVYFLVHACAGVAIAYLAKTYLVHNSEVKNKAERNTIYATLSLITGFTLIRSVFVATRIQSFLSYSFAFFNLYPHPICFVDAPLIGFLATLLYYQIEDYREGKL